MERWGMKDAAHDEMISRHIRRELINVVHSTCDAETASRRHWFLMFVVGDSRAYRSGAAPLVSELFEYVAARRTELRSQLAAETAEH